MLRTFFELLLFGLLYTTCMLFVHSVCMILSHEFIFEKIKITNKKKLSSLDNTTLTRMTKHITVVDEYSFI